MGTRSWLNVGEFFMLVILIGDAHRRVVSKFFRPPADHLSRLPGHEKLARDYISRNDDGLLW